MKRWSFLGVVLCLAFFNFGARAQNVQDLWTDSAPGTQRSLIIEGVDCTFCYCPPGSFRMGNIVENSRSVELTEGFWCLDAPVTQKLWAAVMGSNPSWFEKSSGGAIPVKDIATTENFPVECVSWDNCQDFVKTLNEKNAAPEGWRFSLPTEAQWEYACRAGTIGAYNHVGKIGTFGWYVDNADFRPHDVKTKEPNAWHIYDMHGNVWEWCLDWYEKSLDSKEGSVVNPQGPESGETRVLRGGGWNSSDISCRSYWRSMDSVDFATFDVGVRVILIPTSN